MLKKVIFNIYRFSVTVRDNKLQDISIETWKLNLVIKLFCFIYQEGQHYFFFATFFMENCLLQTNSSIRLGTDNLVSALTQKLQS